jgi:hypothetical protein
VAAKTDKQIFQDRPAWLDQVLGTASPPFNFRQGGSAITGGVANDSDGQQKAAVAAQNPARPKGTQRG